MTFDQHIPHPLQHDGVSRSRRQLEALLPAFAPVDERNTEDLLLYARRYAKLLQFYDAEGQQSGDWVAFVEGDVSVVAAMILKEEKASTYQDEFRAQLSVFETSNSPVERGEALASILMQMLGLAKKLLHWQEKAVPGFALQAQLSRLLPSVTGDAFCRLLAYLRRASGLGIIAERLPLDRYEAEWPLVEPPRGFAALPAGLPNTEEAIFKESFALRQLFRKFYDTLVPVLQQSPQYLKETLSNYPEHEPHMALFLSFVMLLSVLKKDMNTLTKRHLDFYYREVLQLNNKPATMDQAHLVLELAQGFVNGLLETTDRFLDGKDAAGKDILFSPDQELVISPAKLDEEHGLKTLFFNKEKVSAEGEPVEYEILNAFGAPDADADARKATDGKWIPLGSAADPAARFGFAIASPMFLLAEGEREIVLRFALSGLGEILKTYSLSLVRSELERNVNIFYSAEKAWNQIKAKEVLIDPEAEELVYTLSLSPDEDPVIAYHEGLVDQEPLRERLDCHQAVLLFLLDNYGLSVEGDFDLSMEGDLSAKVFNPNTFYLNGEIIFEDNTYQSIYVSQANAIGISPANNKKIWENVTSKLPASTTIPYMTGGGLLTAVQAGSYANYNGVTYRANADLPAGFPIEPGPAADSQLLWGILADSKGMFNPETSYQPGEIVEDNEQLFVAGVSVKAIAPNQAVAYWNGIPEGSAVSEFEKDQSEFYKFGSNIYLLNALTTPLLPQLNSPTQEPIWANISSQIITYSPGANQLFEEDNLVFNTLDHKQYRLTNDQNNSIVRKTNAPPATPVSQIWRPITAYTAGGNYAPDSQPFAIQAGQVYQCRIAITHASGPANTPLRAPGALINGAPVRVWMPVATYDAALAYEAGSFVRVTVAPNEHFFYANSAISAGDVPTSSTTGKWTVIGNTSNPAIGAAWDPGLSYGFKSIVLRNGLYYAASVTNFDKNPATLSLTENTLLWEIASLDAFDSQQLYAPFSGISFNAAFYFAGFRSQNIVPNLSNVWQDLGTIGTYVSTQNYTKDDILRIGNTQFFTCKADCKGISPADGTTIWQAHTATITDYDPYQNYEKKEVVLWKGGNYYATQAIVHFSPSYSASGGGAPNQNQWTLLDSVAEFKDGVAYPTGSFVRFTQGIPVYFQARAPLADIHPGLELMAWEEVPNIIPVFQPNNLYEIGSYVSKTDLDPTQIYRACVSNQSQVVDPNAMVWEKIETSIVGFPFSAGVPVVGAYVEYQDQLFRLIVENPASEPGSNPLEWQAVGNIRFHNPGVQWYQNMHVRDVSGNVYRALQNVPISIPIHDRAFWELVSGSYPYKYLMEPALHKLDIEVTVMGMRKILLENDQGVLNPSKPFMPFGSQPNVGSNFYIGSYEVFSKSLKNVTIDLEWGNLPSSFVTHYRKYVEPKTNSSNTPVSGNDFFKASTSLLQDFDWEAVPVEDDFSLFVEEDKSEISPVRRFIFDISNFGRDPFLPPFAGATPRPKRGFMTFSLAQHFFHAEYPKILAQVALEGDAEKIPNPPYTPLVNSLTLSYSASETLVFKDKTKGDLADSVEQFFHLHPYGWTEIVPVEETLDDGQGALATNRLLPRYLAQAGDSEGRASFVRDAQERLLPDMQVAAGNLFLGIKALKAPQLLNILCQVAEGSENPARDKRFVSWSYLSDNRWKAFDPAQVVSDDTNGLLRPGIVQLNIPSDATQANTMLPSGLVWLRASVTEDPDGVGQLYDVRLHAVKATFENNGNDLSRLAKALPANSLSQLFFRKAVIKKVEQPFASFGGTLEEQDADFYQRISERLRHKSRSVGIFDYERLVMAQFPQVYQVKCITHSQSILGSIPGADVDEFLHQQLLSGIEHRPGFVQVIVLPDLRNQNAIDPLRPRVSNNLRSEIETYLRGLSSGFATVKVENPVFEEVKVNATFTLKPGKDPGLYLTKLNEDLIRYLSPWRFDSDYDLHFGASLHISPIIDYLDELDYIDYVEKVTLSVVLRDDEGIEHMLEQDLEEVCAHTSASVLVSSANHLLTLNEVLIRC
ncbi:MAG: baseplate J/gp47 family protein [Bacteroidia bacterium]|nr:baseplate J/gp47 family protein [Bacteroidia bacterium]